MMMSWPAWVIRIDAVGFSEGLICIIGAVLATSMLDAGGRNSCIRFSLE